MLQALEAIKAKLEEIEAEGVVIVRDIIEDVKELIEGHKAATEEPTIPGIEVKETGAEGVQVITGSADDCASAEIPAGYAPIANTDPAASVAMPAETAAVNASTECVNAQTACDPTPTSSASAPAA